MKKSIFFIILATFLFSCSIMNVTAKGKYKLKKPTYVVALSDSLLYDMVSKDNYDSISFSTNMISGDMGNVSFEMHSREGNMYDEKYGGIYESKFVFYRKGCEPSDTLYSWHVPLARVPNAKEVMVNNDRNILKVFSDCHAKSISVLTLDKKIIAEKNVDGRLTEFSIPGNVKYLTINIQHDEVVDSVWNTNSVFTYPVR